jgi:4-hydroxy-3-methylbut-2-enyl diphosphate reductase
VTLLLLVPLRIEALALGRGAVVTGMGRDRARAAAAAASGRPAGAVAVAGLGGAVDASLRAGDVVVATELRDLEDGVRALSGTAPLANELRALGLRVATGPLVSSPRILGPAERASLAGTGALAVDMESWWLADAAAGRPLAVVRVVADEAGRGLGDLRSWVAGARALRTLRRTRPPLEAWARAAGPRTVLLAGPRSFCAGVERAIEIVERALEQRGAPIYVRKQIVHNVHVVSELERRGAVFVEELDEVPEGATVVFSAHGVSPQVKADAGARRLDVIDATCPLVNKVHAEARNFARSGRTIFLIGHDGHEEVEGTLGEAPDAIRLVETIADVPGLDVAASDRVAYLTQTTLAVEETDEVVQALRERFPALVGPRTDDICYATSNRQQALKEVASDADLVLVVGSDNSSNSKRLVEVSRRNGKPAYLIDDETELRAAWLEGARVVGLTAGASAPESLVQRVVAEIAGLGAVAVEERTMTQESVRFGLPREVAT